MKNFTLPAVLVLSLAGVLTVAARQAPQTTATAPAPQLATPQAPTPVAGTAKTPGNVWLPVKKASSTAAALIPDEELKTFSMPPGYHAQLVAAEPLIESPIIIDFD